MKRIAGESSTTDQFVRRAGSDLAGFPNGEWTVHPGPQKVGFGESGYSEGLVDGDGHPNRHFTGNFVFGYQTAPSVSKVAAVVREIPGFGLIGGCSTGCSSQDVKLGKLGADAAGELHSGKIDKADVGDWIRKNL